MRRVLYRGLGIGDDVTVLVGPFAGHSGRIAERHPDGRCLVVIDECCTPVVAVSDLRIVRSTGFGDQLESIHHEVDQNPDTDLTRGQAVGAQQPGHFMGPPTF